MKIRNNERMGQANVTLVRERYPCKDITHSFSYKIDLGNERLLLVPDYRTTMKSVQQEKRDSHMPLTLTTLP
jgi:hypothetical protein